MKKFLLLASKIVLGVFVALVVIISVWSNFKQIKKPLPDFMPTLLLISIIAGSVVFVLMFIFEVIEIFKEKSTNNFKDMFINLSLIFFGILACDVFIFKNSMNIFMYLKQAAVIEMLCFSLNYWKRR